MTINRQSKYSLAEANCILRNVSVHFLPENEFKFILTCRSHNMLTRKMLIFIMLTQESSYFFFQRYL